MAKKQLFSRHHMLPTSQGGANCPENVVTICDATHRAIHTLFENKMIAEQLINTVNLSSKALRPDVKQWLLDVLTTKDLYDPYEWYKDECIW